jgi:hypothetical protein
MSGVPTWDGEVAGGLAGLGGEKRERLALNRCVLYCDFGCLDRCQTGGFGRCCGIEGLGLKWRFWVAMWLLIDR